jgi:hypothetical protein
MGEQQVLEMGTITLDWSGCVPWTDVATDNRGGAGVLIPNHASGVYEVRHAERDRQERIYIGKAGDLRLRVKGKLPHSGGHRIRELEDVSQLVVRWAVTDRPSAAEEEPHRAHRARFGCLPLYIRNS